MNYLMVWIVVFDCVIDLFVGVSITGEDAKLELLVAMKSLIVGIATMKPLYVIALHL